MTLTAHLFQSSYPRDAMLALVFAKSTCLSSVCLSVCHAPLLWQNEESWRHGFFTTW